MERKNLIILTFDELRADHLSCYGYQKIRTENFDWFADNGVLFENCIAQSNLTPISHASILTGVYPNIHGVRDPFTYMVAKSIAEILKENGYRTSGFVGGGQVGSRIGFSKGFDIFYEPTKEEAHELLNWTREDPDPDHNVDFFLGGWWVEQMLDWLEQNHNSNFFIFAHFMHTHEGMEIQLLRDKIIPEGELAEFAYMDAKIKLADEKLLGPLVKLLNNHKLINDTVIVLTSDHGTNVGEHAVAGPIPFRDGPRCLYPQHRTLYHHDIRVSLIINGLSVPTGRKVKGVARSVDIVPTVLEELGISCKIKFEGVNLIPFIEAGETKNLVAYSEALYDRRPPGAIQSLQSDRYKFIRNLTKGGEEFFRLENDPKETANMINDVSDEERKMLTDWRTFMNKTLMVKQEELKLSKEDREEIEARLKMLGYIR